MKTKSIRLRDHDRFLKFCRLYFQRQGVAGTLQALQAQMAERLQALDGELAAVAEYEGIPLDKALSLDAAKATVSWDQPKERQ